MSTLALATRDENYAPVEGLSAHLEQKKPDQLPFQDWYKKKIVPLRSQDDVFWRDLHEIWQLIALFLKGKQILVRGPRSGWMPVAQSQSTTAPMRQQNKLSFYSRKLVASFVQSVTDLIVEAGDDRDESIAAAKAAETIINYFEREIYDAKFRQHEALCGQTFGTCARYFYFDKDAGGHTKRPVTATQIAQLSEDIAYCAEPECGYVGSPEEFGAVAAEPALQDQAAQALQGIVSEPANPGSSVASLAAGRSVQQPDALLADNRSRIEQPQSGIAGIDTELGVNTSPEGLDEGIVGAGEQYAGEPDLACPACGSPNVLTQPGESVEVENVVGEEEFKLGTILGLSVPYAELRHDIERNLEDSEYVVWTRRYRKVTLQQKFPGLKFSDGEDEAEDTGVRLEENVRRAAGGSASYWNRGGYGSQNNKSEYADLIQWWISPCFYSTYVFPVETKTVTGQVIPAGTKAIDLCPDGMYICTVSGIGQPLEICNEKASDHWVSYPFHLQLFTGIGQGIDDAIEMQRQWNNILSLIYTQIRTAAIPGWLYDKSVLAQDDARALGQPQNNVPADLRIHEGRRLQDLIYKLEPGQIPAHIPWYIGQLDSNMQTATGALADQGLPGADSKTATGSQIFAAEKQGFQSPWLDLKAQADVKSGYILLDLFKKHCPDPRYFPLKGKRGFAGGAWLSGEDLGNGEIVVKARPGSFLPETRYDKQEKLARAFQLFGGPQGLLMAQKLTPALVNEASEALNLDLSADQYDVHATLCRIRLDQLKELEPLGEQMLMAMQMMPPQAEVDPMTGIAAPVDPVVTVAQQLINQLQPPPCVEEPGHEVNVRYYRDWFLDDEARDASELYRMCVRQLVGLEVRFAAEEAMIMGAAADPMGAMQGQQQMAGQQEDQQRRGEQHDSKMKTDAQKREQSAQANIGGGRPSPKPKGAPAGMS